jgi:ribosomal protein L14
MAIEMIGFLYDNSGVETAKILSVNETNRKKFCLLADFLTVAPKKYKLIRKFLTKRVKLASVVIALRRWSLRGDGGIQIRFKYPKFLLLDKQKKFLGTRVYGKVCREITDHKQKAVTYRRIILYSQGGL